MDQYNDVSSQLNVACVATPLQEVLLPDSTFWTAATSSVSSNICGVSCSVKKDIIQAFLYSERSREEMEMLKNDMLSLITYWKERIQILSQTTTRTPSSDMFSRGVDCLLKKSKLQAEMILSKATHTFKGIIELQSDV